MQSDDAESPEPPRLLCKRCGRALSPGRGDFYVVSIVAIADPSPPVFNLDDLAQDAAREIRYLIAQNQNLDASDAENQVHRQLVFHLCGLCYQRWIADPVRG